jgi:uncharacterized membrane protein
MAEYEASLSVQASAAAVFDFISDVRNMPSYLPTTHQAEPQGRDRVRVQGEAHGHSYDSDGWLRADHTEYRLEWGSDGENQYSGCMEVEDAAGGSCDVTVHLSFTPRPDQEQAFQRQSGGKDREIQHGLEAALQSIKNLCEGRGAKIEPPAS